MIFRLMENTNHGLSLAYVRIYEALVAFHKCLMTVSKNIPVKQSYLKYLSHTSLSKQRGLDLSKKFVHQTK